ncbi:MAG: sigma-70 family RNA polymerase sigma factor [Actinomycetota bacterium]
MGERRYGRIEDHLDTIFETARATARSKGANRYEADEVAQLTAYKLWRRWDNDHKLAALREIGGARWRGYIRETARNTHIDLIREHQRRIARQHRAHERRTGQPAADERTGTSLVRVDNVEAWLARASIAELIMELPTQQRKVAARMFILEMSAREVGEELGLEAQTVRKHARAAREALQARLAEFEASGPNTDPD